MIAALLAVPAGANDLLTCVDGAYFSGHAYLCDYVEGNVTPPEGKPPLTQITGAEETWFLESDYDCTTGIEIITWDMLLNKMGKGEKSGEIVMHPYDYSGTFEESLYLRGGKMSKFGTCTGTGDLDGYVIDYQIVESKYEPSVSPCPDNHRLTLGATSSPVTGNVLRRSAGQCVLIRTTNGLARASG